MIKYLNKITLYRMHESKICNFVAVTEAMFQIIDTNYYMM
jgi:hypothetical protein